MVSKSSDFASSREFDSPTNRSLDRSGAVLLLVKPASVRRQRPERQNRGLEFIQPSRSSVNALLRLPSPPAYVTCIFEILHAERSFIPPHIFQGGASDGTACINQCWTSSRRPMEGRESPYRDLETASAGQDRGRSPECGGRWTRGSRWAWRRTPRGDGVSNGRLSLLGGSARPQRFFIRTVW